MLPQPTIAPGRAPSSPAGTPAVELRAADGSVRALTLWRGEGGYCVLRHDPDLVYVYDETAAQTLLAPAP